MKKKRLKSIIINLLQDKTCDNCGKEASLWRLALAPGYDKRDSDPKYFCMECSKKRTDELRRKGIKIRGKSRQNNKI